MTGLCPHDQYTRAGYVQGYVGELELKRRRQRQAVLFSPHSKLGYTESCVTYLVRGGLDSAAGRFRIIMRFNCAM